MEFYPFPARLRAAYNDISTHGRATVMQRENAVEFTGDFIPLIPMGQPAGVEWVYGERTLITFLGTVYLSSPKLLRLVDVEPRLIEAARATFAINTKLPCLLTVRQNNQPPVLLPAEILYLCGSTATLYSKNPIVPEQTIYLSAEVDFLTLRDMPLYVRRKISLRREEELLLCDIPKSQNNENRIALSAYSARLEKLL